MIFFFLSLSLAYWSGPHLAIATLAQRMIPASGVSYINEILGTTRGEPSTITGCSSWHDDVKAWGVPIMSQWHFNNEVFLLDDFKPTVYPSVFNVTSVSDDCIRSLMDESTTSIWALSFCLRSLIHFVGDAHCPSHTVNGYDAGNKDGDKGGGERPVSNIPTIKSLHNLWDSGCLAFKDHPSKEQLPEFEKNLTQIWEQYNPEVLFSQAKSIDPFEWQAAMYAESSKVVYDNYTGSNISEEYLHYGSLASYKFITLAAYRLGTIFQKFVNKGKVDLHPKPQTIHLWHEWLAWGLSSILLITVVTYSVLLYISRRTNNELSESLNAIV